VEFGFVPTAEEWRSGLRHYLRFLPFGLTCGYGLGMLELAPFTQPWWMVPLLMIGVFCGALWFIALFEEFFFRGLLLPWISDLAGSPLTGLAVSSLLFGLAHLPFRGPWNWRHAILTTILGWFCGQAYQEAKGIRAPMVTHALVVMTWIVLFGKN
jgi:membrane protease YdiL (CAAX protease family)